MDNRHMPWVVRAIAGNAARDPQRTAVEGPRGSISYGQLWQAASRAARLLRATGVRPGDVVGVGAERGTAFVTASLACWQAGAAYLPLPSATPVLRLRQIIQDSGIRFTVASGSQEDLCHDLGLAVVPLSQAATSPPAATAPPPAITPRQGFPPTAPGAAYVIYTSGSTGKPKGVVVGHQSLANLIKWHIHAYRIGIGDRALHTAGLGFDAAVWEIWPYLAAGATLIACPDEDRLVPDFIVERLADQRCTVAFAATPLAEELLSLAPDLPDLRYLFTGGDVLRLTGPVHSTYQLVNHYGPTEATVVTTSHAVGQDDTGGCPPIGTPIDGVTVLLLDPDLRPVAEGSEGEIHIGGRSLALGYLRDPDLTRSRFITVPDRPGTWYRTGDLAVRNDGVLTFTGRADPGQLKIRGVRLAAAEVESALMACPGIRMAAVTTCGTGADAALIAIIAADSPVPAVDTLLAWLRTRLDSPAIPNRFVFVGKVPLNENGKIDRRSVTQIACRGSG